MLQNQNAYQKEFATNWYKERAKNPKYSSQLGDGKLDKILSDIDKATWKNPTEAMRDNLISQGYTPTDQNIKSQLQAINAKGTKGFAVPSMYSYYGAPRNTWHEGVGHIVGDNNPAILDSTPITPIGDALSARDVYNAVTEKDWTGAGLAALGILPFIPSGLRQLKPTARYIPSVSRSREQDLLNAAFDNIKQKREYLSDVANERNRVLESVNDYAHRVRAEKADQMFGTNYSDTYKLLSDLYEHKFFSLPEVQGIDMKEIGKMQAQEK